MDKYGNLKRMNQVWNAGILLKGPMDVKKLSLVIFLGFCLIFALIGCGDSGGGTVTISGYVRDFSYSYTYLEGVKVDIGGKVQAITNSSGYFQTPEFPTGTYTVSFVKNGYRTYSFSVFFDQPGDFQFSTNIYISSTTYGSGIFESPSFIRDLNNNTQLIIDTQQQVGSLIAIAYDTNTSQNYSLTNVNISTDIGIGLSTAAVNGGKLADLNRSSNIYEQRLRDFDRRINQQLLSQGYMPGVSRDTFGAKSVEPQLTFFKYNFDENDSFTRVTANLRYNSDNINSKCLIYVDENQNIDDTYVTQLGQAFDSYYNTIITYFGDLAVDIDSFDKVYILLSELVHEDNGYYILGYFSSINEFPKYAQPYSNAKEMLYLTTYLYGDDPSAWLSSIKSTAAHEFQHLINYSCRNGKEKTPTWINEGLSMLAEDIAIAGPGGHNPELDSRIEFYLKYHEYDTLQDWQGDGLDYASAYMFMRYFADRYGEDKLKSINTANVISTNYYTDAFVNIAGDVSSFDELFVDWLSAVALDYVGYQTSDPVLSKKYLYQTLNLSAFEFPMETSGYIDMARGSGTFIYLPNLASANRIDVGINGDSQIKLRLIMLPVAGASFSSSNVPSIVRIQ